MLRQRLSPSFIVLPLVTWAGLTLHTLGFLSAGSISVAPSHPPLAPSQPGSLDKAAALGAEPAGLPHRQRYAAPEGDRPAAEVVPAVPPEELAADLSQALVHAYGQYGRLVTPDDLLNDLQTADVVCIGEAHYDRRDMETAFEILRQLARRRLLALAVERLSYALQPELDALHQLGDPSLIEAKLEALLRAEDYRVVWGERLLDQSGYPVNTPSRPVFEAMLGWAVRTGNPLIGLDVTLADRATWPGELITHRNRVWQRQINSFSERQAEARYLVVVIGGLLHCSNASGSLPSLLRAGSVGNQVVSIGQREAMYPYRNSTRVVELVTAHSLDDLIVHQPEFALVGGDGVAELPDPPDYWIAVHEPGAWDPWRPALELVCLSPDLATSMLRVVAGGPVAPGLSRTSQTPSPQTN